MDKTYDKGEVTKRVIDLVYDYMDIRKHRMGDDIFIGDIEKEISKLDGVQNLVAVRVFNKVGSGYGYSNSEISQEFVTYNECANETVDEIIDAQSVDREVDLKKSDKMLFTEANSMFEIKYKNKDIKVIIKQRS